MITWNVSRVVSLAKVYREGVCLSTDEKPVDHHTMSGSKLMEMDTSKLFIWDDENAQWREWGA